MALGWIDLGHAQVQLVGKIGNESMSVVDAKDDTLFVTRRGERVPLPAGVGLSIVPAPEFSPLAGEVKVYYFLESTSTRPGREEAPTTRVAIDLRCKANAHDGMYAVFVWEVDGVPVATHVRSFFGASSSRGGRTSVFFFIPPAQRRGYLRTYLFYRDRSLAGVASRDQRYAALRARLDAGDFTGAKAWLERAGPNVDLSSALLEQIARGGDADLLRTALTVKHGRLEKPREINYLLRAAAQTGRAECVALLLSLGADPNAVVYRDDDEDRAPPLNWATASGSDEAMAKLLAAGANPNGKSRPPLQIAIQCADAEGIRRLLDAGARWPEPAEAGSWFSDAALSGRADVVALFLAHGMSPSLRTNGTPMLVRAGMSGNLDTVRVLLKAGAKPDEATDDGATVLMIAALAGNSAWVHSMIELGADPRVCDKQGRTAATYALTAGYRGLALELAQAAPVAGTAASSLLHAALGNDDEEMVKQLADRGAAVALDRGEETDWDLDRVVQQGNRRLLRRALDDGLDPNRKVHRAWTLAGLAERYQAPRIMELLEERASGRIERLAPKISEADSPAPLASGKIFAEEVKRGIYGSAEVEVIVASNGRVVAPVVRSADNEAVGRAARHDAEAAIFRDIPDQPKLWRRATLHYESSLKEALRGYFRPSEVEVQPLRTDNFVPRVETGAAVPQAAVLKFQVTPQGEVVDPEVLVASAPGLTEAAIAAVKRWHYQPAKKDGAAVGCQQISMVLLPSGAMVLNDSFFEVVGQRETPIAPPLVRFRENFSLRREKSKGPPLPETRGVVVTRLSVDRAGFVRKAQVLGSSEPKLAARAQFVAENIEVTSDNSGLERSFIWVAAPGNWND